MGKRWAHSQRRVLASDWIATDQPVETKSKFKFSYYNAGVRRLTYMSRNGSAYVVHTVYSASRVKDPLDSTQVRGTIEAPNSGNNGYIATVVCSR